MGQIREREVMTEPENTPHTPDEPNTRPGPRDEGGHGGMATREQEAREQAAEAERPDLPGDA